YRQQADQARKENNLRVALVALEQANELEPTVVLQQEMEPLRKKLQLHDAAVERASQLRREPQHLEEACKAYEEALQHWDTLPVRQALADARLALTQRRDRLAVANFKVMGDTSLVAGSIAWAGELLPHFRRKDELVERSQTIRILEELRAAPEDYTASREVQKQLAQLAKTRFLVVSSISNLAGITIHAHLVDLQSGLIVQTAKITAPTTEDASRQLPVLAAQLMMNDEEKLAYERRLQMYQPPAVVDVNRIVNSGVPFYQPGAVVQPVMFTASRPPALGNLRVEDFDRLPVFQSNPLPPSAILLESSRPLRGRLLALQLELGDNFFRRGLHREALVRFQFARELDPANVNILSRINSCQQYIPAGFANPVGFVPRRERLASLNFFVAGDNRQVPPELSTWLPDQLGPYFSPTFEVLDRSEVYWMMGRLGLTLGDVLQDALVRRWLGRALDVRYLLVGRVQLLNGIVVTTSLLDVEQGWEIGRGQVVVPSVLDIKPYLPELARWTLLNPAERQRLELEAAAWEAEYLRAQEAARRGQWEIALNLGRSLQRKQPLNIRIGLFLNDCEGRARLATLEATRQYELERQRQLVLAAQRRQAELLLQAERARQAALERA
ncbi:MAG TPA: hypothetical protein PKD72_08675, partial [Gemmatales bacterium]|nr:hypothetical protein [Gemmatales bacterium]